MLDDEENIRRSLLRLLRRDGYVVTPSRAAFDANTLSACAVLVIANAQPSDANWGDYPTPTPSAFAPAEIAVSMAR